MSNIEQINIVFQNLSYTVKVEAQLKFTKKKFKK